MSMQTVMSPLVQEMATVGCIPKMTDAVPDVNSFSMPDLPNSGLCVVCANTKSVIRVQSALARFEPYRKLSKVYGLPCPVCDEENARASVSSVHQAEIDRLMRIAKVDKKFLDVTLDDFVDDVPTLMRDGYLSQEHANRRTQWKNTLAGYLENLKANMANRVGVTLLGSVGTGKTLMTCIIARAVVELRKSVLVIPERGIVQAIGSTYDDDAQYTEADVLDQFASVDHLFIDDFGTKSPKEWIVEKYHNLIDAREQQGLATSFSSNVQLDHLKKIYPRQMSRAQKNVLIEMVGGDIRGSKLERSATRP